MNAYHLDTYVLVFACAHAGSERAKLLAILDAGEAVGMSAWAWYELRRGPRTPEQMAAAEMLLGGAGIVPVSADFADEAAEQFRLLGSPRRRAADILIGVTARVCGARLLTRNAADFAGIANLVVEPCG